MTEYLTGGCLCGAVTYTAEPGKTLHYMCHCADCRRYGGSAAHTAIVVAASDLNVTGTPKVWAKVADSKRTVARHFCEACGGHLFTSPWPEATRYSIKAGTLDDPKFYRPAHEIWTRSMVPWVDRPSDLESFEEGFLGVIDIGT